MGKKNKEELNQTDSKSRAKYKCPENLESLINVVNEFHPFGLLDFSDYSERVKQKLSKEEYSNLTQEESFKLEVQEVVKDLGTRAGWFVLNLFRRALKHVKEHYPEDESDDVFSPNMVLAFIGSYLSIKSDIDNLIELSQALNDIRKGKQISSSIEHKRFSATLVPTISENGKVKIRMNTYFFNAVDGITADRLRICEICNRIFWAKREDSETCSTKCFNNLRVRRYRNFTNEEKAERKANREANKERNRKLKQLKEKKNDTL